ncbi:MAG: hypothetical protein QXP27_00020 [Candidatus Methanomethyliaceae archaeon]
MESEVKCIQEAYMTGNEVQIAFEILLEEIEAAGNAVIRHGSQALDQKRFDEAKQAIELGVRIEEFRNRVKAMQSEWVNLYTTPLPPAKSERRKPVVVFTFTNLSAV